MAGASRVRSSRHTCGGGRPDCNLPVMPSTHRSPRLPSVRAGPSHGSVAMTRILAVRPAAIGWNLRIDAQESFLVFQTGAQAESAARRMARHLADAGEET